jgi:ABC-type multidrug transport system fused ATPase/permease subunit
VIETAVIVGALFIGGIAFLLQDAQNAVATLAIFMAAGTRIAPAVLRIQQSLIQIRGSIGQSIPTLELIEELGSAHPIEDSEDEINTIHEGFSPDVTLKNVSLTYPGNQSASIKNITLHIDAGSFVAIVGPSGAGKTSLIDLILGVLEQDSGKIRISELDPQSAVRKWPGAVAYVPQDVILTSGTVRENIALGYPVNLATDEIVKQAVSFASLDDLISSFPDGLDTKVGERGAKLSGGQRQRVGIARAVLTVPKLLVLDEATSALDGETEHAISQGLENLRGDTTIIIVAHRLSTIMNADSVIYMKDGAVVDIGSFEELRIRVPEFNSQAKLMGL